MSKSKGEKSPEFGGFTVDEARLQFFFGGCWLRVLVSFRASSDLGSKGKESWREAVESLAADRDNGGGVSSTSVQKERKGEGRR